MSRIKSKNTAPEIIVRRFLFANGFRFRLHQKNLPSKPDIVLKKYKTVIFVHGCFWHGHEGCKYFVIPKTRTEWWINKIVRNKELDHFNTERLSILGWNIITVYECELKKEKIEATLNSLITTLRESEQ